jgi:hypothetical protein
VKTIFRDTSSASKKNRLTTQFIKMKNRNNIRLIALVLSLICTLSLIGQQPYTTRQDPKNPKRTIVEYKPQTKKLIPLKLNRDVLDASKFTKPPLVYKPFEMKNPKTGNTLNPQTKITIKIPGKKELVTTVKQYFDELNKMEKKLAETGRTLRVPATFVDFRPAFTRVNYTKAPKLSKGFTTRTFIASNTGRKSNNDMSKPGPMIGNIEKNDPIRIEPGGGRGPAIRNWNATLYIAQRFENHGHAEFPAEWVKLGFPDRHTYPVIVQVPNGLETAIKRIDWQVSDKPFDGTLKEVNVPGIKLSGSMNPVSWANFFRGVPGNLPNYDKFKYAALYIFFDPKKMSSTPIAVPVKKYYIRAICYNQAGEVLKISSQVVALYGDSKQKAVVLGDGNQYNSVPPINYQFPDAGTDLPFGVFVKGSGLKSMKAKTYKDEYDATGTVTGYKLTSKASFGVKYFNFMSLVDAQEPISKPLTVVGADFEAVLGLGTATDGTHETPGVRVTMTVLDQVLPPYEFAPIPNIPNTVSLEKDLVQPLNVELLNMWFFIGPVPLHVTSAITGQGGVRFSGTANLTTKELTGSITPFLETRFDATAGVDALIAYATVTATVNPLISLHLPMTINSNASSPLSFSGNLSGLSGKIFLTVGFFYPCPDLGKVIGWLVGSEETPLCECKWEYNIFDFGGFNHSYNY